MQSLQAVYKKNISRLNTNLGNSYITVKDTIQNDTVYTTKGLWNNKNEARYEGIIKG